LSICIIPAAIQNDLQNGLQNGLQNVTTRARKTETGKKRVPKGTPKETPVSFADFRNLPDHSFLSKFSKPLIENGNKSRHGCSEAHLKAHRVFYRKRQQVASEMP
jgi:hypothetical protein